MSKFTMPVHWYMSAPVHTVRDDIDLNALHHRFISLSVSSLPVVDADSQLKGMVSRTDLLQRTFASGADYDKPLLDVPAVPITEIMSRNVHTVDHEAAVSDAAVMMLDHHIHRVYIGREENLVGVLSARDVMPAVADLRLSTPVGQFMSTPLFVIWSGESISNAMSLLIQAQVSGVVILGEAGPMGVFTQAQALCCRNLPLGTLVEDVMDTSILTIDADTPMYLAAEEAVTRASRRIVVTDSKGVRGIVTPLDFVVAAQ